MRVVGTAFMLTSVVGLGMLGAAVIDLQNSEPIAPIEQSQSRMVGSTTQPEHAVTEQALPTTAPASPITAPVSPMTADTPHAAPLITEEPRSMSQPAPEPITHVDIPAIGLSADVVPANLVARGGGMTWDVPGFKIGHAESTAGAGQVGNAVLFGHISSLHAGNVFAHLDRIRIGQAVQVFTDTREFDYTVVTTTHVPRTDTSVMAQDSTRAVSLITCTGMWLPTIWDYTERLVVRAELF